MKRFKEYIVEESDQTNSSSFKKWFGKSKVVDKSKNPLVVYHGTPNKSFTDFNKTKIGSTSDSGMWGRGFYFTEDPKYASQYAKDKGNVLKLYLSMQKPYIIKSKSDIPNIDVPEETIEDLEKSDVNYSEIFTKYMKDHGYDGIIAKISKPTEYVVFEPNQIKSVI